MTRLISSQNPALWKQRLRLWSPVLIWMGLIFWISAQSDLPKAPSTWVDFVVKKGAHASVYAVLAGLIWHALGNGRGNRSAGTEQRGGPRLHRRVLSSLNVQTFVLSVLYAISDEWHQTFVPGRHGRPFDVLVDASGIVIALVLIWRVRHPLQRDLTEKPVLVHDDPLLLDHLQHSEKRDDHLLTR